MDYKVCDSREPSRGYVDIRPKLLETGWMQKKLNYGDFLMLSHDLEPVCITRKSILDLLSSVGYRVDPSHPSRVYKGFQEQLAEIAEQYRIKIILIEGSWEVVSDDERLLTSRGIEYSTYHMIWNFLLTWQLEGFTLYLTMDAGHTIKTLNRLFAYFQRSYHMGAIDTNRAVDSRAWAFPSKFRSVGKKLLDSGLSLKDIANMSYEELKLHNGIGDKGAMALQAHFTRRSN